MEQMEKETTQRKTFVESFKEVNPEMMVYILDNLDNSFIYDMHKRIEERGTLTAKMYSVVYSMMLPVAKLDDKPKNLEFKAIRFGKKEGQFGISYTLYGETNEGELIRVFFSSLNEKHNNLLLNKRIYDADGFVYGDILERGEKFVVSGSFDGYKIKRAKLAS